MLLLNDSCFEYFDQLNELLSKAGYIRILATLACIPVAYSIFYAVYLSPLRGVPGPFFARLTKKRAQVFGLLGAQAHRALEEYEEYGDIYVYQPNAVSISNPSDIRRVLSSHQYRKAEFYEDLDLLGVKITITARDPEFASMRRRQIGPYLSNTYLAKMEKAVLEHGILAIKDKWDGLLKASDSGQIVVNYHTTLLYATFDTIGSLAFGKDFGALRNDDPLIEKWLNASVAFPGMQTYFPLLKMYPFSLLLSHLERLYNDFIAYGAECIAERRELLKKLERGGGLGKKPTDLLQGFLEAEDTESKARMSPTEVHAESILMLLAGSETTTNTLVWTIHLLMLYPDCYKRAVEEVRSAFAKDQLITFSDAKAKLPYLEACIYESLRRLPVAGGQLPRVAPAGGAVIGGHFIPGGAEININMTGANMNKNYWRNPRHFDPTRFLDNDEAKRSIFTFSYGVRVCPGRQLAWFEMLTILANILKDYDMRFPDDYRIRGPHVLDDRGHPKLMDRKYYFTSSPANVTRDCRVAISKRC